MALLLLRHALSITDDGDGEGDDDASTFFSVSMLAKQICIYVVTVQSLYNGHSNLPFNAAVLAPSSRFSLALLHHDLGHQYLAATQAKTGKYF